MSQSVCEQLQGQINSLAAQVRTIRTTITAKQEELKKVMAQFLPTDADDILKADIARLNAEIEGLDASIAKLQAQLNAAIQRWNSSGLRCVNTSPVCIDPEDRVLSIPFITVNGLQIVHQTTELSNYKDQLVAKRNSRLSPIEACLDPENGIAPKIKKLLEGDPAIQYPAQGSQPLSEYIYGNKDLNPPLIPVMKKQFHEFAVYIISKLEPCIKATDSDGVLLTQIGLEIDKIIVNENNWGPNPTSPMKGVDLPPKRRAGRPSENLLALPKQIITQLENEAIAIKKQYDPQIAKIQEEINELLDPNSRVNKEASDKILELFKKYQNDPGVPNPEIHATTTITAPGGPGMNEPDPCSKTVSKTLATPNPADNPHNAVTYDKVSGNIVLTNDGMNAYKQLGAGGCQGDNPIWRHPVTIVVHPISVVNTQVIKEAILRKVKADPVIVKELSQRVSTSEPKIVTPIMDLSNINPFTDFDNTQTLRTCIKDPAK